MNSEEKNEHGDGNDENDEEEEEEVLLLKVTVLDTKALSTLISFLEKYTVSADLQFRKNRIEAIHVDKNEDDSINAVSCAYIPEWKLYEYECHTELLGEYDPEKPSKASFRLGFNPQKMSETLKDFKAADSLTIKYYAGSRFMLMCKNEDDRSPAQIQVKQLGRTKKTNPIIDEDILLSKNPFIKIKCQVFTTTIASMTKTKDHLASQMSFRIQNTRRTKALRIHSSRPGDGRNIGPYQEESAATITFRNKPKMMKNLALYCKGFEKNFINVYYNNNTLRFSSELGYVLHDFFLVKSDR